MLADTSMVCVLFSWALVAAKVHAAPILPAFAGSDFAVNTSIVIIGPLAFSLAPLVLGPPSIPAVIPLQTTTQTAIATEVVTATVVLSQPPVTISVSAPASTITQIITVTGPPPSPSSSKPPPSPTSSVWSAPAQMTDLSAFKIAAFPGGKHNLLIVDGIPAEASATAPAENALSTNPADALSKSLTTWDNSSSALQLLYPENSINPASKPQGGAEFYATPLDLSSAKNVSLEYSVFFPADYDWVKGGKLPGLYGGHTGCSGGNNALTCFSTRLMWRSEGLGELYLYAPKAKQTDALCGDPQSVCDAAYGFSIGRGSFRYAAGGWTHVRQNVVLNTPGKQDGGFTLDVNGKRVIGRSDVFYRDAIAASDPASSPHPPKPTKPKPTGILGPLGPLLGNDGDDTTSTEPPKHKPTGLLGPLIGQIIKRSMPNAVAGPMQAPLPVPTFMEFVFNSTQISSDGVMVASTLTTTVLSAAATVTETHPTATVTAVSYTAAQGAVNNFQASETSVKQEPVSFTGIFFSTFFGGHQPSYATPRDQHTWFKDFAVITHS